MAKKIDRRRALVKKDALAFQNHYFSEILELYGIDSMYYEVIPDTVKYSVNGEFSAEYKDPIPGQILFDQVPKISTLKKLGWSSESDSTQPLIHIDYNTPGIQQGALFSIEDPMRPGKGRLFRVTKLSMGIIYPMCITAQVVAIMGDIPEKTLQPELSQEINEQKGYVVSRPSRDYD